MIKIAEHQDVEMDGKTIKDATIYIEPKRLTLQIYHFTYHEWEDKPSTYDVGIFIEGFCPSCHEELVQPGECTCIPSKMSEEEWSDVRSLTASCIDCGHWRIKP